MQAAHLAAPNWKVHDGTTNTIIPRTRQWITLHLIVEESDWFSLIKSHFRSYKSRLEIEQQATPRSRGWREEQAKVAFWPFTRMLVCRCACHVKAATWARPGQSLDCCPHGQYLIHRRDIERKAKPFLPSAESSAATLTTTGLQCALCNTYLSQ